MPSGQDLICELQGFHKGTITMVVVSVALALWICVVWWQDRRTGRMAEVRHADAGGKLEEAVDDIHELGDVKGDTKGNSAPVP